MVKPSNQRAYAVGTGTSVIGAPVQEGRDPTNLDVNYILYQEWVNTSNNNLWKLMSFTSTSGTVLANWLQVEGSSNEVHTLTGNTGGAVGPTANNINILGTSGQINVSGNPATSTLTLSLAGGGEAIDSFIPDTGTSPVIPAADGSVTMSGSGSIQTVGGTNQLTTQLTGLTNHAVLVGAGTATIKNVGPSATTGAALISGGSTADPLYSTTFLVNDAGFYCQENGTNVGGLVQISLNNLDNTNSASAARFGVGTQTSGGDAYIFFNRGSSPTSYEMGVDASDSNSFKIQYNPTNVSPNMDGTDAFRISTAGAITFDNAYTFPTADGTAGQVLTTNGAGTVTWSTSGEGGWTAISASQTLAVNNGYFCTGGAGLSLALPATSAVGDTIDVVLDGSTSWTITQPNAGTRIRIGNQQTTLGVGGSLASTAQGDTVRLVCETANARWAVVSMIGNITVV